MPEPIRGTIEKRQYERIVSQLQIKYYVVDHAYAIQLKTEAAYKDTTLAKLAAAPRPTNVLSGISEDISQGGLSLVSEQPLAIGTHVVCADTDEEAERLAKTVDLNIVRRAKGEYLPLASPEDAAAYDYSPNDRARVAQNRTKLSVGSPTTVKARLEPLIAATQADELMVTTMVFDHEERKHSYELLAQTFVA